MYIGWEHDDEPSIVGVSGVPYFQINQLINPCEQNMDRHTTYFDDHFDEDFSRDLSTKHSNIVAGHMEIVSSFASWF
jgi:hypothetical protein